MVLALVAIVGIAATGSTPHGSDRSRAPSDSFLDSLFTLWLVAIAAGGVLLVYGLMQRKAIAQELASGRYRRTSLGAWVAFVARAHRGRRIARYLNLRPKPQAARGGTADRHGQLLPTGQDQQADASTTSRGSPGSRSPSSSVSASPPSAPTSSRSGARARRPTRARTSPSSWRWHSTTRSTTSAPRRIHDARSSRRTLVWSACSRRAAFRDTRETADEYLGRVLRASHPTPTPSRA